MARDGDHLGKKSIFQKQNNPNLEQNLKIKTQKDTGNPRVLHTLRHLQVPGLLHPICLHFSILLFVGFSSLLNRFRNQEF